MSFSQYQQIIVHCGIHKTGTSYLQHVLKENADILADHGIDYPIGPSAYVQRTGNHSIIASNYELGFDVVEHFENHVALRSTKSCLLISGEEFSRCFLRNGFLDKFVHAAAGIELKFVFYLRRQDYLRESVYAESVKNALHGDITKTKFHFDFLDTVLPFVKAVGQGNVIIRPYNSELWPNNNLVADFFSAIGRPDIWPKLVLPTAASINASLSRQHTFLLSLVTTHGAKTRLLEFFKVHRLPADRDDSQFFMSPTERKRFRLQYAETTKQMALLFGILDADAFLGVDEPESQGLWTPFSPDWQVLTRYLCAFADWENATDSLRK